MGQINCQCEQVLLQEPDMSKHCKDTKIHLLSTNCLQKTLARELFTRIILTNPRTSIDINLFEGKSFTFGTTADCHQKWVGVNGNSFKLTVRMSNKCLMVRDCGVGYGVFMMKKKIYVKGVENEAFVSLEDKFVMIKVKSCGRVSWTIFDVERKEHGCIELIKEEEIKIGEVRLLLKRQKSGREWSVRRHDRKWMCLLITDQQRIRPQETLRLGCEYFNVGIVSNYIQSSKIIGPQ